MFAAGGPIEKTPRLAVFAIAPIPVLAFVGSKLDNKIPASLFQRHRDTEDWKWKSGGKQAAFQLSLRQTRPAGARVALVLSLSGTISLTDLPRDVQEGATIYEIALTSEKPSPTFLKQTADLSALRDVYYEFHAQLGAEHGYVDEIDVFPAVPAPVAILLGRERLMKRHPALRFYDYDRANGGFTFQMTVK
jgi:hypothetical protein